MQGLPAIPTKEMGMQQQKMRVEVNASGMQKIASHCGMQAKKKKKKKAVSTKQMEKQRLKSDLRRTMFQQKKRAEELADGMAVRNAALEQLGYKVKEEEIESSTAKEAGNEAATWAAKSAKQNQKYPSRELYHSVSVALQAPPAADKIQQQEKQQFQLEERARTQAAAMILKSRISAERAEEATKFTKAREAGRARRAKAILGNAMRK